LREKSRVGAERVRVRCEPVDRCERGLHGARRGGGGAADGRGRRLVRPILNWGRWGDRDHVRVRRWMDPGQRYVAG
jgi:hypothetical protein